MLLRNGRYWPGPLALEKQRMDWMWELEVKEQWPKIICLFAQDFMGCGASAGVQRRERRMLELTLFLPIHPEERRMRLRWGLPSCCQCLSVLFNERSIFFIFIVGNQMQVQIIHQCLCSVILSRNQKQNCLQCVFWLERETKF